MSLLQRMQITPTFNYFLHAYARQTDRQGERETDREREENLLKSGDDSVQHCLLYSFRFCSEPATDVSWETPCNGKMEKGSII